MTSFRARCGALLLAVLPLSGAAAPSASDVARLGTSLTPVGAERAGNADGSIPPWTGGLCSPPPGYKPLNGKSGLPYLDPFAGEKPLFTITAGNAARYRDRLDDAQWRLLKTHPDTYRLTVYKTHRTACHPKWVYDNTVRGVMAPRLVGSAPGLADAHAQVPFPLPQTGQQALYNHLTAYRPASLAATWETWLVDATGRASLLSRSELRERHAYWDNSQVSSDELVALLNVDNGPAGKAGSMDLRILWARSDLKEPRAWSYVPGQRRARLAPDFFYDTVSAHYGGLILYDEIDGFDGKMDRFDFRLLGKRELFIPYNTYAYQNAPVEALLQKSHVNPDLVRWELHRVWVVEGLRKPGVRHAYSRKLFFLDEDSWNIVSYMGYDDAGQLYRSTTPMSYQMYDAQVPMTRNQVGYDHVRNGWFVGSHGQAGTPGWRASDPLPQSYFTAENMVAIGVR